MENPHLNITPIRVIDHLNTGLYSMNDISSIDNSSLVDVSIPEEKVKRLSRENLEEGIEAAHHEIKLINRMYSGMTIPKEDLDVLEMTENWCIAANRELQRRRIR